MSWCSTARGSTTGLSLVVPLRLRLVSLDYSPKVPLKLKVKNTCWILLPHFNVQVYITTLTYAFLRNFKYTDKLICILWLVGKISCICKRMCMHYYAYVSRLGINTKIQTCLFVTKKCFSKIWKIWGSVYIFLID